MPLKRGSRRLKSTLIRKASSQEVGFANGDICPCCIILPRYLLSGVNVKPGRRIPDVTLLGPFTKSGSNLCISCRHLGSSVPAPKISMNQSSVHAAKRSRGHATGSNNRHVLPSNSSEAAEQGRAQSFGLPLHLSPAPRF